MSGGAADGRGDNIVLVGFMATGKGSVARELGAALGRPVLDTDAVIAGMAGDSVPGIFARHGEGGFRRLESAAVRAAAAVRGAIIATGGGAIVDERNVRLLRRCGRVVWLRASVEAILDRTRAGTPAADERPLLAGLTRAEAAVRVTDLLTQRDACYERAADLTVETTDRSPGDVAAEIRERLSLDSDFARPVPIPPAHVPGLPYPIVCGDGLLGDPDLFAQLIPGAAAGRRCLLVTDPVVGSLYGEATVSAARRAGMDVTTALVPPGERAKRLPVIERLYQAMLNASLGRDGLVLALGGGAVGDAAGFAAATYMRGVQYVQLPTTLLAQVDSGIGGKTAVDLGRHKNTVGSFHQPAAVLADVRCFSTLPVRELRSGMAEVLKYGLIYDSVLWTDALTWAGAASDPADTAAAAATAATTAVRIVSRCLAHKAAVVAADERDTGPREALNFGHTLGHALEARATGRLRHGEAVAWGMDFAVWLGEWLGLTAPGTLREVRSGLALAGFRPPRVAAVSAAPELMSLVLQDKKARGGHPRFLLLRKLGEVLPDAVEVPLKQLAQALVAWSQDDHRDWGR